MTQLHFPKIGQSADAEMTKYPKEDSANVHFPPPLIHTVGVLSGIELNRLYSLELLTPIWSIWLGVAMIVISLAVAGSGFREFGRNRNPVLPNLPIKELMTRGPFRYSRNPLYVALALLHAGLGLVSGSVWILLTLLPTMLIVRYRVISREEAYLTRRFGQEYLAYKTRVRRWV